MFRWHADAGVLFSLHPTSQVSDAFDASFSIDLAIKVASWVIDEFFFLNCNCPSQMLFKCVSSLMQCNLETPCNIGWLFHVLISMHTKRCFQTPARPLRHDGIAVAIKTVSFTGTAVLLLTATILGPRLCNPIIRSLSLLSFSCKWSMRSTSSGEDIWIQVVWWNIDKLNFKIPIRNLFNLFDARHYIWCFTELLYLL